MATRNIGRDCAVSIYFRSGAGWGAENIVAQPSGGVEGNARRVQFTTSNDVIDVSGISDVDRYVVGGRSSATLTIEKLVSTDILAKYEPQPNFWLTQIGRQCKVVVTPAAGAVAWTFYGVIAAIEWGAEDSAQIETIRLECSAYAAPV